jgi:DNA polymerase I
MIVLVDGNSLAHRVFHTVFTSDIHGKPCGVITGFLKTMSRILIELKEQSGPVQKIACFDFGRCAWRTELYPLYKQNRKKDGNTSDFLPQLESLQAFLPSFGFGVGRAISTESDDLIGVLAQEFESRGEQIIIVSSDKDLWQLLTPNVKIYDLIKDRLLDLALATEELGFTPDRLVEFKALAGDASDNIPGAKGVGDKGALQVIQNCSDLQTLLNSITDGNDTGSIPSGLITRLKNSIEEIRLAGKLCTIAQYRDQLWSKEAQTLITSLVDRAMGKILPVADEVAMAACLDMLKAVNIPIGAFL